MVISIGINQFFTIGFFISLGDNSFKAAAFINAVVMVVATYLIFSKQPWKPSKKNMKKPRYTELKKLGTRKVWNDKKMDIETIEDSPVINDVKFNFISRQITENLPGMISLCEQCQVSKQQRQTSINR
jgi:hypothetical protein